MIDLPEGLTDQDIIGFDLRARKGLGTDRPEYTVEPRIAGLAVELTYEEGNLTKAFTTGRDTPVGAITPHIKTILTVPLALTRMPGQRRVPALVSVWGTAYVDKQGLADLNRQRAARGLTAFADSKAVAADSLRQTNPRVAARRPLNLFCHGADLKDDPPFLDYYDLMLTLQQWGLRVNRPHIKRLKGVTEVIRQCHDLEEQRVDFPYDLDGAIITLNISPGKAKTKKEAGGAETSMVYLFLLP